MPHAAAAADVLSRRQKSKKAVIGYDRELHSDHIAIHGWLIARERAQYPDLIEDEITYESPRAVDPEDRICEEDLVFQVVGDLVKRANDKKYTEVEVREYGPQPSGKYGYKVILADQMSALGAPA